MGEGRVRSSRVLGTAAVLGSLAFFVTMNVLTKHLSRIGSSEKILYRMLVGIAAFFVMVRLGRAKMRFGHPGLLVARGGLGAVAVLLYFYSIDHTTLARASFFLFTYPAWGALFSWIFLKEPLGWKRVPGIVVIYAGAWLIMTGRSTADAGAITRGGDIAGLFCGLASGAATTTIRALHRYDSTWMIFFFFGLFGAAAGGLVTFGTGSYVAPTGVEWVVLLGIGLSSTGAHLLFTTAFRYMDVTAVGALEMLQAPLSAVAAYFLFREGLGALTIGGGALVLVGGFYLAGVSKSQRMEMAAGSVMELEAGVRGPGEQAGGDTD